jgi:hypothetical protein
VEFGFGIIFENKFAKRTVQITSNLNSFNSPWYMFEGFEYYSLSTVWTLDFIFVGSDIKFSPTKETNIGRHIYYFLIN